jgi:DinB superfamily
MEDYITNEKMRFPVGKFEKPEKIDAQVVSDWIEILEIFPIELKKITQNLEKQQLNYKYRANGWTIKQVIHHCADSHINSFVRFKLTLTEETPTVKPYNEAAWANLIDANDEDVFWSLQLIEALHKKWVKLLSNLNDSQLKRKFYHPENKDYQSLEVTIGFYAWHCKHHLAHIEQALALKGQI